MNTARQMQCAARPQASNALTVRCERVVGSTLKLVILLLVGAI